MLTYFITLPFSILSIIGNIVIIAVSLRFKILCLSYPFRMIFFLAIFDLFLSAALSIPNTLFTRRLFCKIQCGSLLCSFLCGIMWKAFMSFEMFSVVALQKGQLRYGFFRPLILIVVISVFFSALPGIFDIISDKGDWCGVDLYYKGDYSIFFVIYVVILYSLTWICIIWNIFVTWKIYFILKDKLDDDNKGLINKIRLYPVILILVFAPASINYALYIFNQINVAFNTFAYCILASNGLLNALVYGLNKEVKCLIKGMFRLGSTYTELIYPF